MAIDYREFIDVMDTSIDNDPFLKEEEDPFSTVETDTKKIAAEVKKIAEEAEIEEDSSEDEGVDGFLEDKESGIYEEREPLTEDEILQAVKKDRDAAVTAQGHIANKLKSAYNAYHAIIDEKYNTPGRSTIVSSDVMDTIEWMMPSLMRVFTAAQDIVVIQPVGGEDVSAAEQHQALINYQFNYKMEGFTKFYTWFKDALTYGLGVVKLTWETFYEKRPFSYDEMTEEEFTALSIQPNISVEEYDEYEKIIVDKATDEEGTKVETTVTEKMFKDVKGFLKKETYSGPWLENIPVSSFYIEYGARSVREANFVCHRVRRTMDYLRRMQRDGIYHNVDEVIPYAEGDDGFSEHSSFSEIEGNADFSNQELVVSPSEGREYKWIWECWVKLDVDGDGLLEPLLVTFTDNVLLRVEENPFDHGEPPFETIVPIIDCHRMYGISVTDLVIEFQRMKTSLYRNLFDNIAFSVNNFFLVSRSSGTDIGALLNIKPGSVVFTDDVNTGVREMKPESLSQSIFTLFEYLDTGKENRTGITKYNQGLDSSSLNKMLALDTPIPLIDGTYKLNKDIVAGDMVVGRNGKGTMVTKAHPIDLPKRAFELTFESGDIIRAGGEHRWFVKILSYDGEEGSFEVLPSERIYNLMLEGFSAVIPTVEGKEQSIVSIKEIDLEPMRCISVAAEDEMYCCGKRLTVTLNTATGVSAIMTASQQRIELVARLFAETGVKFAFRKMISLNQQFITDKMVIRLFNKPLIVTPDQLDGSFDLMVNVGIGAGLKELQQSQMLNLLNILPSMAELGLVKPKHVYYVISKLLESMGYKDIDNFIEAPVDFTGTAGSSAVPAEIKATPMSTANMQGSPLDAPSLFGN